MVRFAVFSAVFAISTLSALAQLGNGIYQIKDYRGRLLTMNEKDAPCTVQRSDPDSKKWHVVAAGDGYTFESLETETFAGYTGSEHGDLIKNMGLQPSSFNVWQATLALPGQPAGYVIYGPKDGNTDLMVAPDKTSTPPNVVLYEPDVPGVPEPETIWYFAPV